MARLRSIVHKTWAYQDSNKSSQVIGISVCWLIIRKTWAYQWRHDQSFTRLGLIKIPISHSQDYGISQDLDLSRFRSIIRKTMAYQVSDQLFTRLGHIKTLINHLQDLGISKHMPIMSWICQSCQWLIRVRWMINRNTVMPKSCKWLIEVRICPNLVNDWSKSRYAQILQTIYKSLDMPKSCKWLIWVWICQCLANDWLESR